MKKSNLLYFSASLALVISLSACSGQPAADQPSTTVSPAPAAMKSGDAMKGDAMKGDAMKGDAMKGDAMKGDAMKGEPKKP